MRKIVLLLIFHIALFAYIDADMDGVDDSIDRCPNTRITELVDKTGCSIASLDDQQHFDVIMGLGYAQYNYTTNEKTDTATTSIQADYYYNRFSVQLLASYFNSGTSGTSSSGANDTALSAYYRFGITEQLSLRIGGGLLLPTYESGYNNNKTDYMGSLSANYSVGDFAFFGGYAYTQVNDDDISEATTVVTYQNTNAFNGGAGYYFKENLYGSISYYQSNNLYAYYQSDGTVLNTDDIKNISLYGYYSFDKNWFGTASYAYGLSDTTSDNAISLRFGYYF